MSKRQDLEDLRTRLGALETSAPDAERFHQKRQALVRELADVLKRRLGVWVMMGAPRVAEIRARLAEFEENLVPLLTALQATLTEVTAVVTAISTTRLAESRVSASAADWGAQYQGAAKRCLSIVTSVAEAEVTQRELNTICQKALRLQGVVGLFVETETLLRRWKPRGDFKADVVDSDFRERWLPTFIEDGATAALSSTMETGLAPLRDLETAVETPPVSTAQTDRINAAIEVLRRWSERSDVAEVTAAEVQSFRARALQLATEEDGTPVGKLLDELNTRVATVQNQVQRRTEEWFRGLKQDAEIFRRVCPEVSAPQGGDDLDRLAQLTEIDPSNPDGYADWKGVFDRARDELSQVATTRRPELAEALTTRVSAARDRLVPADASQPFPPDVQVRVATVQEGLDTVAAEHAAEPLQGLRDVARMDEIVTAIVRDHDEAWGEITTQRAEAADRHEDLMGLLRQVSNEEGPDVGALIVDLSTEWEHLQPGGPGFTTMAEDVTRRQTLVDHQYARASALMKPEVDRLRGWIRNLPKWVVAEGTPTVEDVDSMSLADVVQELQALQGDRTRAGEELHTRRCAHADRLTAVPTEIPARLARVPGLTAEDRQEAQDLVAAIGRVEDAGMLTSDQPDAADDVEALVGVLEELARLVDRWNQLARRLWGDEQEAHRLLEELQGTLRQCADQGLQAWHAERWRRYSACVEVACGGHVGWAVARRQLEDTRHHIERLRVECHRIAAARVTRQCAVVEGAITRTEQSARRREMVETLEAVEADAEQGRLASPEVRTRLADLAVAVMGVRNG